MIIFDLDGTLADCEHRRHFVDASKNPNYRQVSDCLGYMGLDTYTWKHKTTDEKWKPDWKAFYEACDKDTPILPVIFQFICLKEKFGIQHPIQIWSGRCESVREKTSDWLNRYFTRDINWINHLKMRPIGDNTPDDQLKERWLDEVLAEGKKIDFVFEYRPKVVRMWRRRGIFVFDCNQIGNEF